MGKYGHFITFYTLLPIRYMICEIEGSIEYNLPEGLTFIRMFPVKYFLASSEKIVLSYGQAKRCKSRNTQKNEPHEDGPDLHGVLLV